MRGKCITTEMLPKADTPVSFFDTASLDSLKLTVIGLPQPPLRCLLPFFGEHVKIKTTFCLQTTPRHVHFTQTHTCRTRRFPGNNFKAWILNGLAFSKL